MLSFISDFALRLWLFGSFHNAFAAARGSDIALLRGHSSLGMANTYTGLIVPLIASATGTFFFRQFFRSVPEEMIEAARIDGAGPFKFFIDILVPLSKTMIACNFHYHVCVWLEPISVANINHDRRKHVYAGTRH